MTQYLLSVHSTQADHDRDFSQPDADMQRQFAATGKFNDKLVDMGVFVFANGLEGAASATVVRAHEGDTMITDGPYLETKEHIGGFWIIEVADLDVALKLAEEASAACEGAVEVRPFQSLPEA
jgi:hypothetical protein